MKIQGLKRHLEMKKFSGKLFLKVVNGKWLVVSERTCLLFTTYHLPLTTKLTVSASVEAIVVFLGKLLDCAIHLSALVKKRKKL